MIKPINNKGMVLLYALLVASIVLVIGLTLSNILYRQIIISAISREMNQAYYAANTGRDCVQFLYNMQVKLAAIGEEDLLSGGTKLDKFSGLSYDCGDGDLLIGDLGDDIILTGDSLKITYTRPSTLADVDAGSCALIDATVDAASPKEFQDVKIRGYNADCESTAGPVIGPRTVERVLCIDFAGGSSTCTGSD